MCIIVECMLFDNKIFFGVKFVLNYHQNWQPTIFPCVLDLIYNTYKYKYCFYRLIMIKKDIINNKLFVIYNINEVEDNAKDRDFIINPQK